MPKKKIEPDFFAVNRSLLNSDRWLAEPFTRGQAWVDLFGLAQYRDGEFRVRGIVIDVKRGQLAYSQLTLASRWKWSRNKVRRYLKELEKRKDIEQQNTEVTTVITILRYDHWQGGCDASDVVNDTTSDTTEGQQKDNRKTTEGTHNKKDKKEKKDKNNTFVEDSHEFQLASLLFECILERKPDYKQPNIQTWAKEVDLMMRVDKRRPDVIRNVIIWCQQESFWQGVILSTNSLRKSFDKLEMKMGGVTGDEAKKNQAYDNLMEKYGT